jgi:hypothetical protein
MIAIVTSNSISVKPVQRALIGFMNVRQYVMSEPRRKRSFLLKGVVRQVPHFTMPKHPEGKELALRLFVEFSIEGFFVHEGLKCILFREGQPWM